MNFDDVLSFWFDEIEPSKWWVKDADFDSLIADKFLALHAQANRCELFEWRKTARGRLAEIIVLDQFSRNIFRDSAKAFLSDSLALALSQEAISLGKHNELNEIERSFIYMPYMHSESSAIHEVAMVLFSREAAATNLEFERRHKAIIDKFGRYPHRNPILGRQSTAEELMFLEQPGSSF